MTALDITLAAALGAIISFSPRPSEYEWNVVRACAFLAVAGALMMRIIDNELARAFGLMGAASIVRYRYGLRSSQDATSLILSLGLGLAVGSNLMVLAGVSASLIVVLKVVFGGVALAPGMFRLLKVVEVEIRGRRPDVHDHATKWFKTRRIEARLLEVEAKETKEKEPSPKNGDEAKTGEASTETKSEARADAKLGYKFVYELRMEAGVDQLALIEGLTAVGVAEVHVREIPAEKA